MRKRILLCFAVPSKKDLVCWEENGKAGSYAFWLSRVSIRYGQFKQEMTNITDTALSSALKELIQDGLVNRKQYNEVPLRVEYELTSYGLAAVRLLRQIANWADGSIPTELSRGEMPLCLGCDFND